MWAVFPQKKVNIQNFKKKIFGYAIDQVLCFPGISVALKAFNMLRHRFMRSIKKIPQHNFKSLF